MSGHWASKALWLPSALLLAMSLSGCSFLIHTIADPLAEQQVKRLKLPTSTAQGFTQCLDEAGGACRVKPTLQEALAGGGVVPSRLLDTRTAAPRVRLVDAKGNRTAAPIPADARRGLSDNEVLRLRLAAVAADRARDVLNHPVQGKLNDLFNAARQSRGARSESIEVDADLFKEYLDWIEEATELDGWESLERELKITDTDAEDKLRRSYINAYFKAYFRNGKFYSVTLDGAELEKKVIARLRDTLPGLPAAEYDRLARQLFDGLGFNDKSWPVFGKIAAEGFVTRGGQDIKMPAVEAELDLASGKTKVTKVDTTAVVGDLVRVLLHAIYDAHDRLPGVTNATGYSKALPTPLAKNEKTGVDETEFGEIETRASRIELLASSGVGRVIRGIGLVALNNEAIATAIETAVGVAARKHTEKVLWCWVACGLNGGKTAHDASMTLPDTAWIEIRMKGPARTAIGTAEPGRR